MREFIEREIDLVNLNTLLRVWAAKATFDREIFLPGGYETTEEELSEMVRLEKPALMARLSETPSIMRSRATSRASRHAAQAPYPGQRRRATRTRPRGT